MTTASGKRLLHVATTDISLDLLIGPQLRAFADAGYEVHTAADDVRAEGHTHHVLEHATRPFSLSDDGRAPAELYRLFRELRLDIVHTHNPKPGIYGRLAAKAARVPLIVNAQRGMYVQPTDWATRRLPVYALERLAATCSDVELVQSNEDLDTLRQQRVPERKPRRLGNGIKLERFRPPTPAARAQVRNELDLDDDDVVCGTVGRLVWEKGYAELFESASAVLRRVDRLKMVVVGPFDDDKGDPLTQADVTAAERAGVRFLSMGDDVDRIYGAMDLYVLASHREGFPRSAMEAAASGVPVIATDIRGCR